jgi:pimeloyl-ACP methyl ester carboxylesterase/DNA-binding CsgD family transcriptional regulator
MPADTHDLIAAIYAATLSPNDFHKVFDSLDSLLFLGEDGDERLSATALSHIDMARNIQERIGRVRTDDLRLVTIAESVPNPSYIISNTESVLVANGLALGKYGPAPATLKELVAVGDVLRQVRHYLRKDDTGQPLAVAGQVDPARSSQTSVLINRIDPSITDGTDNLYLLSIVDFGFDEKMMDLFRAAYGLTPAESRVAVLLASGLRLADIAIERRVSVETVRTQVKIIKNKTAVRDLPGLVRLMCGFSASRFGPAGPPGEAGRTPSAAPMKTRRQILLGDGRRLDFLEQGAAGGRAVILFHNLPYGAELCADALRQAHADGLRVIAPFRPGMGGTDSVATIGTDELLDAASEDCRQLMQHLGIRSAVLVSHAAGAPFALRFARLHPERVERLIAVSKPPAWKPEWIADLPQRQRFVVRLARHFPQMLPVVAWAMIACLESRHANEFVRHGCKDGRADARAVESQETIDLIAKGSIDALRRSVGAFSAECLVVQSDFSEEARRTPHKFHILHGDDDRIIPLSHSLAFAAEVPGTSVEVVADAGQLLFYSHWHRLLAAIRTRPAAPASHRKAGEFVALN